MVCACPLKWKMKDKIKYERREWKKLAGILTAGWLGDYLNCFLNIWALVDFLNKYGVIKAEKKHIEIGTTEYWASTLLNHGCETATYF